MVSKTGPMVYALHQDTFDPAARTRPSWPTPTGFLTPSDWDRPWRSSFIPTPTCDLALAWGKEDESILQAAGIDYDDYAQGLIAAEPQLDRASRAIFTAWLQT